MKLKKLISLLLCFAILVPTLIVAAQKNHYDTISTPQNSFGINKELRFEKSSTDGRINLHDKSITVLGKNTANKDVWVLSKGITGKKLTDYTLKFDYTVADRGWTVDTFMLRVQDSENPNRTEGYYFVIQGTSHKIDNATPTVSTLSIQKDNGGAIKTLNYDTKKANILQLNNKLTIGDEYTIEIVVEEATISVWFYKKGTTKPAHPTLIYTDPEATYKSGDIGFAAYCEGYSVTNISLNDSQYGKIMENYIPELYNADIFDREDLKGDARESGMVILNNGLVTIKSDNGFGDADYPISTNAIYTDTVDNFIYESQISLADLTENVASLNFGNYKVSLIKSTVGSKVVIFKQESELASALYDISANHNYFIKVKKDGGNISVWISNENTYADVVIEAQDSDWKNIDKVYFSTTKGEFSVCNISFIKDFMDDEPESEETVGFTFKKHSNDGRISLHDKSITVLGKNSENKDAWFISKGITGKKLTDYTLKFDYTVADRGWTVDAFLLRIQDSNEPSRADGYSFVVQGSSHKIDSVTPTVSTLSIQKNSTAAIKTLQYDEEKLSVHQLDEKLNIGDVYTVEISVKKATVNVWFYLKGSKKPSKPTITYTDPDATYQSGDIGFSAYSEGYSITNISLTDDKLGKVMEDYIPQLYNSQVLNKEDIKGDACKSGTVTLDNGIVNIVSNNGLDSTVYPVSTNNLNSKKVEKFTYESNIMFSNIPENEASLNFGGYKLSFIKSNSGDKVVLLKEGEEIASAPYSFIDDVAYCIKVIKNNSVIKAYLSRVGDTEKEIISIRDTDWLAEGDVWLSTEQGEFSVYNISFVEGVSQENGVSTEGYTNFSTKGLTFEKNSDDGFVNFRGGRVMLSALNTEGSSGWLTTKRVTGKDLTNYNLKYSYIVASNTWTVDAVMLRNPDSDNITRTNGYSFVIQGASHKIDGTTPSVTTVSIQKDSCNYIKTLNYDKAKQSIVQLDKTLVVGDEYIVEISVNYATIEVWFYKADESKPSKPTVKYTDPESTYVNNSDIAFVARDEGYTISNITIEDSVLGTICKDWKPDIYNIKTVFDPKALTKTNYETGTVNLSDGRYHFISNNTLHPENYSVVTNGLFAEKDVYLKNFDFCSEFEFNSLEDNSFVIDFCTKDYNDEKYTLNIALNGELTLYKCGKLLSNAKVSILDKVRYQLVLSNQNGSISVYVYRLTDTYPDSPVISVKDSTPLSSGIIKIITDNGDFYLSNIAIKSFDESNAKGPTGTIFKKNFEDDDYNLEGLEITLNNTEHTTLMREDGNSFLRVVGRPYEEEKANVITGTNARSQIKFGSDELYNFDLTAKIRFKSAFSPSYSYVTVAAHADPLALRNNAMWLNVGPRGSAIVHLDTENGLNSTNAVASNGLITAVGQSIYMPNESENDGMKFDGFWHELKVSVRENTYSIFVDGELRLSYIDIQNSLEKGAVYLYGYGINFDLDDIFLSNNSKQVEASKPNISVYENDEGFVLKQNEKTKKLVGKNLSEFEWQFEYKAGDSNWGRTTFLYKVNNNTIAKNASKNYSDISNAFGFTISGTNISSKTNKPIISSGIYNNGITVFAPNTDPMSTGNILPLLYTQEEDENGKAIGPIHVTYGDTSSERSAIDFGEITDAKTGKITTEAIDVSKWMTVNVRVIENKIFISVWQTGNKGKTFRAQSFVVPADAAKNITEGDLMIVNGDNSARIKNIKVNNLAPLIKKGK